MGVPVVFIVFNRPAHTERVFAEIARAKPPSLLIVADGPRQGRAGEAERCAVVRQIVEKVNWPCEVLRCYSAVNLGCGHRVASGLKWAFGHVDEAIILEDDTLPHSSFFRFCEELLDRYRGDERVMHVSGNNNPPSSRPTSHSYYFSRYDHIWGWATWRRAYEHYDFAMKLWPTLKEKRWLHNLLGDNATALWWQQGFDRAWLGDRTIYDSWDMQWLYSLWVQNGLSITPCANLVTNIGWGVDATHTQGADSVLSRLPLEGMQFPLRHPTSMIPDFDADRAAFRAASSRHDERNRFSGWLASAVPLSVRRTIPRIFRFKS